MLWGRNEKTTEITCSYAVLSCLISFQKIHINTMSWHSIDLAVSSSAKSSHPLTVKSCDSKMLVLIPVLYCITSVTPILIRQLYRTNCSIIGHALVNSDSTFCLRICKANSGIKYQLTHLQTCTWPKSPLKFLFSKQHAFESHEAIQHRHVHTSG